MSLIIGLLVTARLASLFANESGPMGVFAKLRAYLAKRQTHSDGLYDMISCVKCNSMYIGAVVALATSHGLVEWAMLSIAYSMGAVIILKLLK